MSLVGSIVPARATAAFPKSAMDPAKLEVKLNNCKELFCIANIWKYEGTYIYLYVQSREWLYTRVK
jgi:hypothetical protein